MSRLVYSYLSHGYRRMTDAELQSVVDRVGRQRLTTALLFVGTVCLGLLTLLSVVIAAGSAWLGWSMFAGSLVAFLWMFALLGSADRTRMLYGRALRTKEVERFELDNPPDEVREFYDRRAVHDDVGVETGENLFWLEEEVLFRHLKRQVGEIPRSFESLGHDGVVLLINGRVATKVINLHVARVEAPSDSELVLIDTLEEPT